MKKNSTTSRIVVFVLFLAIITAIVISGTFAKYTETKDGGTATANIAKWSFNLNGLGGVERTDGIGTDLIANSVDEEGNPVKQLAPGTRGYLSAALNFNGCQVAVEYEVTITINSGKPTNLSFYSDESCSTKLNATQVEGKDTYKVTGVIAADAITSADVPVKIYWDWPYQTGDTDDAIATNDANDLADSVNNMSYTVSVVATQWNPATALPATAVTAAPTATPGA